MQLVVSFYFYFKRKKITYPLGESDQALRVKMAAFIVSAGLVFATTTSTPIDTIAALDKKWSAYVNVSIILLHQISSVSKLLIDCISTDP